MKRTAVTMIVLSGLCYLPCCFPRLYIYVEKPMTWADAQNYCRWKYTDLASVRNDQDWAELKELLESEVNVWIGLRPDTEAWRWSLADPAFYSEGEAEFRKWIFGQPYFPVETYFSCVAMFKEGKWGDEDSKQERKFMCYNGTVGTKDTSSSYIFVKERMNWEAAQTYCIKHYTDLASVRNQAENDQIKEQAKIKDDEGIWIGLYRNSWKWSDGSAYSFSKWASNAPTLTRTDTCTVIGVGGKWFNTNCHKKLHFACYTDNTRKQLVRLVLEKTGSSVDMEELKDSILQKFNQGLKGSNLSNDIKLRWVKQPDGKVFHKINKKSKDEKSCPIQ